MQKSSRLRILVVGLLILPAFGAPVAAKTPEDKLPALEGVSLSFSHRGEASRLGQLHLAETGARNAADRPGDDYWLRLTNASPHTLRLPTQSMYISNPPEWVPSGPGKKVFALADQSEVSVLFETFQGTNRFGDTSSYAHLPTGRSIVFSVPKKYLAKKRSITVEFAALTPAVLSGSEKEPPQFAVSFAATDLPKEGAAGKAQ